MSDVTTVRNSHDESYDVWTDNWDCQAELVCNTVLHIAAGWVTWCLLRYKEAAGGEERGATDIVVGEAVV